MKNMKTALVTGAAGFLGAHLTRWLQDQKHIRVLALDDLSGGFRDNLPSDIEFIEGSVTDEATVARVFERHDVDYVYHLAAYAAEGLSHFIRRFNYTNNLIGSVNLINQSVLHDVERFVFTSSIAVYGDGQVPMEEEMKPLPEDPYGIAKYAVEMDLESAQEKFGLNYVIFRPHNVYGEYQNIGDKYRNVVGIFMNQIMRGEPMTIFGDGEQKRAFTYVGDIIRPIGEAAWTDAAENRVFNIGAEKPHTVNELAEKVIEAMGKSEHPIRHLDPREEVKVAFSDHSRAREVFGDYGHTSLQEGLAYMADWAKRVGAREGQTFENIEVPQQMPEGWNE
jgi:UDP-glucose 4-epimerase